MAPRKGTSPFSPVRSPQLLDESTHWYVLSNRVCGERPLKYFAKSKFPSRFPQDIVKVKHSALRTQDGALYDGKSSSDDEIIASSSGIIAIFLRHLPDSPIFQEEAFHSLKGFLTLCGPMANISAITRNSRFWLSGFSSFSPQTSLR